MARYILWRDCLCRSDKMLEKCQVCLHLVFCKIAQDGLKVFEAYFPSFFERKWLKTLRVDTERVANCKNKEFVLN